MKKIILIYVKLVSLCYKKMLQNLPNEIQLKIFREYIPIKDKYSLLKIKNFYKFITTKYCWKSPIRVSLKSLHLHNTYLLDKIKPGNFIRLPRNVLFQVFINYKTASVTIVEYRSKHLIFLKQIVKKIHYPIKQVHEYITHFYKGATPVDFNDVYETWDRYIITFNPNTCILYYNDTRQYKLQPHYFNTFCSSDKSVSLLKTSDKLTIFFVRKFRFIINDMCSYLQDACNMGNEEFKYKFPFLGSCVKIVKAYSFKKCFKRVCQLNMKLDTKNRDIQLKFLGSHRNLDSTSLQTRYIFHLLDKEYDYKYEDNI